MGDLSLNPLSYLAAQEFIYLFLIRQNQFSSQENYKIQLFCWKCILRGDILEQNHSRLVCACVRVSGLWSVSDGEHLCTFEGEEPVQMKRVICAGGSRTACDANCWAAQRCFSHDLSRCK